ncbi:MAG TPA: hypothetical protein VLV56_17835 [Burkholderiales bacterium]|nr:hypothetical protein [Burkholderiales bacterium]
MRSLLLASVLLAGLAAAGCQSAAQVLSVDQQTAMQTALRRGQFEMACPQATGTVLSSNLLQPIAWRGLERSEYTVGVEGCGQRRTYVVVCQLDSPTCFAASGR